MKKYPDFGSGHWAALFPILSDYEFFEWTKLLLKISRPLVVEHKIVTQEIMRNTGGFLVSRALTKPLTMVLQHVSNCFHEYISKILAPQAPITLGGKVKDGIKKR